jgi:hypothetical protein
MTVADLIDQQHPLSVAIREDAHMLGQRRALWDGQCLYVSEAMAALLADPDSVEMTARAIDVVVIPKFNVFTEPLPMMSFE